MQPNKWEIDEEQIISQAVLYMFKSKKASFCTSNNVRMRCYRYDYIVCSTRSYCVLNLYPVTGN